MSGHRFLAFDLGAESGRATVGTFDGNQLSLEEIHRFNNEPVKVGDTVYWDVLALYSNMLKAMRICSKRFGDSVEGVGINTWGVDFGLLAEDGKLLQNPVHYRDRRTEGLGEEMMRRLSGSRMYRRTGIPVSAMATLGQLFSLRLNRSPILSTVATLLLMPDLLGYFLSGVKSCERTAAIMTQLYDARSGKWSEEISRHFDLPFSILPPLVDPGSILGELSDSVGADTGLGHTLLIAPCTHDTGSAVAGVPGEGESWAFVSSGTWSVVGALTPQMITSPAALSAGFANELTLRSFFLCKNLWGLWLLQETRRVWQRQGKTYTYEDLCQSAEQLPAAGPLIDPNHECFFAPADMLLAIRDYCRETGQTQPREPGEVARCILDSLALAYRQALDRLSEIMGKRFSTLYVVGGGCLNASLCQNTANATQTAVRAGPVEATVAGNIMVQALARGYVSSPQDIRDVVRRSTAVVKYEPEDAAMWEDRYAQYLQISQENKS